MKAPDKKKYAQILSLLPNKIDEILAIDAICVWGAYIIVLKKRYNPHWWDVKNVTLLSKIVRSFFVNALRAMA